MPYCNLDFIFLRKYKLEIMFCMMDEVHDKLILFLSYIISMSTFGDFRSRGGIVRFKLDYTK